MSDYSKNYYGHEWQDDAPPALSAANMLDIDGFIKELDSRTKDLKSTKLDSDSRIAERAETAAREAEASAERAMSGTPEGYADVAKRANTVSNRNLLDNAWFTVNQRGWTSGKASANAYTVDRWVINNSSVIVEKTDDGISIIKDVSAYGGQLYQKIEDFSSLAGKVLTVSALIKNTTAFTFGISENGTNIKGMTVSEAHDDWTLVSTKVSTSASLSMLQFRIAILNATANGTVQLKAVKLEVGELSTLGNDVAPNMAEELLKCQRYFFRLANKNSSNKDYLGIGFARDSSYIMYDAILPVSMRGNTISVSTSANAISYSRTNATASINAQSVSGYYLSTNRRSLMIVGTGLTTSTAYSIYLAPNGYIDFSADL